MNGIRIRFDAYLRFRSKQGDFPLDTIAAVYVTNRDGCTFGNVPVNNKGLMQVDFEMHPEEEGVKLTDSAKLHFFFLDNADNLLKPVCAKKVDLVELADKVKEGAVLEAGSNFNTNTVSIQFVANPEHSRSMHLDLLRLYQNNALTKSVLSNSETHLGTMKLLDEHIRQGLSQHTQVTVDNGGHMFQSIFTAHILENEATLYSLYHLDFDEPHRVPKWLCTYLLAETLNHNAVTIEQVKSMDLKGLTDFLSSYAQAPMRSASATPYMLDNSITSDPVKFANNARAELSELFKRPYSHPYHLFQGKKGTLCMDDCKGLVVILRNHTNHLGYMYTKHREELTQTESIVAFNNFMKQYFPRQMFHDSMSASYQNKLMDMAMFLGELVAKNIIECKVTLVSANGASMGGEGPAHQVQAHACATMVCNHPDHPYSVMLEGTTCMTDDQKPKFVQFGTERINMADIANHLTCTAPFNTFMEQGLETKMALHMTHARGSFYRTAFCQNDTLIGSQIGEQDLMFGVDMEYLSDDKVKVYMPVTGKLLEDKGAYKNLQQYIVDRRAEIHLPHVNNDHLMGRLDWEKMQPFKGCKELTPGRPYTTCLVHVMSDEKHPTDQLMKRITAEVTEFNSKPENLKVGVMRVFPSMDGVSKVLHMYTDDQGAAEMTLRLKRCG